MDSRSLLPIGTKLQMGRYRVDRYLSSGSFGNTYVITHLQFEEQYALKEFFMKGINEREEDQCTIKISNGANLERYEQQRKKFKKEARRLKQIQNKNIVSVYDLFDENGTSYYVMDLIHGQTMQDAMEETGRTYSESQAINVVYQILEALDALHEKGIWHLDLKPTNIMIDDQGIVKLIDFGASKQMNANNEYSSTSAAICYTPGYAPTEQVDQNIERIGPWTDLYALGATLYYMLTASQPPSSSEILDGNDIQFRFPVSEDIQQLITWMMMPNRKNRPQSVAEVQNYLDKRQAISDNNSNVLWNNRFNTFDFDGIIPHLSVKDTHIKGYCSPSFIDPYKESSFPSVNVPNNRFNDLVYAESSFPFVTEPDGEKGSKDLKMTIFFKYGFKYIIYLKYIEGAKFTMGDPSNKSESPVHEVSLDSFYLSKFETTYYLSECLSGYDTVIGFNSVADDVSWNDCQDIIQRLNYKTGLKFRLPTEAEWEYAARGGNMSKGYIYAGSNNIDKVAWHKGNSNNHSHGPGDKRPNELGLYDMSGNVMEWCEDWYDDYPKEFQINPIGPKRGRYRVLRGGCWDSEPQCCRVTHREKARPNEKNERYGFRLALSVL